MADNKRFAFIPLSYINRDRALEGELVLDNDTGDVWTKTANGDLVSATADLQQRVQEVLNDGETVFSFMHTKNRRVYRFYFEDNLVKLDSELRMSNLVKYFKIRSAEEDFVYYVTDPTPILNSGVSVMPFENNKMYFVEFYNESGEMISQQLFTARYAPSVLIGGSPEKIINRIEIHFNKDFLYIGENINSLVIRVLAVYDDNSSLDVTEFATTIVEHNINVNQLGTYNVRASYYFNGLTGDYVEALAQISVVEDIYAQIFDLVVTPRKIVHLNDGSRCIKLTVVAYFDDGTVQDVSDNCIISSNFDDQLFNEMQYITVKFNAGHTNVIERNYDLLVMDDGSASENGLLFNGEILELSPVIPIPAFSTTFRVRDPEDLNFYYTPIFAAINYSTIYVDKVNVADRLQTGDNVIVEFYDASDELIDSQVYTAIFQEVI